jgi:hypothetical protein
VSVGPLRPGKLQLVKLLAETRPVLAAALTERFVERFLAAWPEGNLTEDDVRSHLAIGVGELEGQPCLSVEFSGVTSTDEWDGSERDAEQIIDDVAETQAFDCEGDRWTSGEGWREYRP